MLFFVGQALQLYSLEFIRRIVILDIDEKSLGEIGRWPGGAT